MDLLDKTKKILNLQDKDIKALYLYGSRVYGTDNYKFEMKSINTFLINAFQDSMSYN